MDNKKLILILALLGGGYLLWKNSKVGAKSVGQKPADLPTDVPTDVPSGSEMPKSQKDCPEGFVFVPLNCAMPPCEGGSCVEAVPQPKDVVFPDDVSPKPPLVELVELPIEAPKKDPFTEFLTPVEAPALIQDPYSQIFNTQKEFGGFSFSGSDKNTLALQEDVKQSTVKQSNFN